MSSLETNTYTAKPTVQVANAITVTKPIVTGNILTKDPGIQNQQPKRIQPLLKPVKEHQIPNKVKGSAPTIFQLKNLHNPVPASVTPDISRIEITRKQPTTRDPSNSVKNSASLEVKKPESVVSRAPAQQTQPRRIFSLPKQTDVMGNDQARMQTPGVANRTVTGRPTGNSYAQPSNVVQQSVTTPASVSGAAMTTQATTPSITSPPMASIIKGNSSATTESHVLTTFDTRSYGQLTSGPPSMPAATLPSTSGPRVVSTSSSKTITGSSSTTTGFLKGHKPSVIGAQHAAVIHSSSNARGTQNQSIRPGTPPIRTVTAQRPANATNIAPAAVTSTQNPTTVQITIHQPPKNSVSTVPSDRLPHNSHHAASNTLFTSSDVAHSPNQQPQQRQKLVISQSPSGVIQQNRTTIPLGPDAGRINAVQTHTVRKSFRPIISSTGQHDYVRSDPQPIPGTTTKKPDIFNSRPGVAMHSVSDHKLTLGGPAPTSTPSFYPSPSVSSTVVTPGQTNFFQSSGANPSFTQHQNYKTAQQHHYSQPSQPGMSSINNSTLSGPPLIPTVANPPGVINNIDNSSQDSTGSNTHSGSPRPSILRKRTHDSMSTVVVKKVLQPGDRLSVLSSHGDRPVVHNSTVSASQIAQSSSDSRLLPLTTPGLPEKDNASQSSTDTAMSSESPPLNHKSVKQEVPDNCTVIPTTVKPEPAPPDVSPRKKPRKQLLNTAAELKDQHNSSTEEETETKFQPMSSHSIKAEPADSLITSPIKEDFVDREGVRWVKMRQRQVDPLLCFYNCTWKSRNNHFQRRSDIKVKEERRPVVSELSNQKGVLQKASGWKFYHISAQFHEMIESEEIVNKRLSRLQDVLPPSLRQHNTELAKLYELAQANKQRCSLTKDQLQEAKCSMFSILDQHKSQVLEIIQKHHSKRPVKKKERS